MCHKIPQKRGQTWQTPRRQPIVRSDSLSARQLDENCAMKLAVSGASRHGSMRTSTPTRCTAMFRRACRGGSLSRPRVDRRSTPTRCTAIFRHACRGGSPSRPSAEGRFAVGSMRTSTPTNFHRAPVGADYISARGSRNSEGAYPGAYTMRPYTHAGGLPSIPIFKLFPMF